MSLPVALDTNVLVRLLTNDDAEQARRAADLIDASVGCFVPITVVLELEWVLRGAYRLPREAVIQAVEGLMAIRQVHVEPWSVSIVPLPAWWWIWGSRPG